MPGTLLKVTYVTMLLIWVALVLEAAQGQSVQESGDLATQRQSLANWLQTLEPYQLDPSPFIAFINMHILTFSVPALKLSLPEEDAFLEKHAHLWTPFFRWLGVLPSGGTLDFETEPILVGLKLKDPENADTYKLVDRFTQAYINKVAIPGRIPASNVHFQIERMSEFVTFGKWALQKWKGKDGNRKEVKRLRQLLPEMETQMKRLQTKRSDLNLDASSLVAFLRDYVESRLAVEPQKVPDNVCIWEQFLVAHEMLPRREKLNCQAKALIRVKGRKLNGTTVQCPVLAAIRLQSKETPFQVETLLDSFYRGYRDIVRTNWHKDRRYEKHTLLRFVLERMGEFVALADWSLGEWEASQRDGGSKWASKTDIGSKIGKCTKKCKLTKIGSVAFGAGVLAFSYGRAQKLWNHIVGKFNGTEVTPKDGPETPEKAKEVTPDEPKDIEEEVKEIEEMSKAKEEMPDELKDTEKYKEEKEVTSGSDRVWLYILGRITTVGVLAACCYCGCRSHYGSQRQSDETENSGEVASERTSASKRKGSSSSMAR